MFLFNRTLRPLLFCGVLAGASPAADLSAFHDAAQLCEWAADEAARRTGVPDDVLLAVALTETGRAGPQGALRPWPWAVNVGGDGHWFATRGEAEAFIEETLSANRTSFDVGCFQLNYRWHGPAFSSANAMLDPAPNALYAARFLASLHDQTGDWPSAAGAYHSSSPDFALPYRARFERNFATLTEAPRLLAQAVPRENAFPLLKPGASGSAGSVVPIFLSARPLIGD